MISLFILFFCAIIIGVIAKALHPGEDPVGLASTLIVGLVGTYIGGFINWILGHGQAIQTSGLIMGVVGGIIALVAWRWWNLRSVERSFWTGKCRQKKL